MIKKESRKQLREKRKKGIRKKIIGTNERPRLCVYKSLRHIYAAIVNDMENKTLCSVATTKKEYREMLKSTKDTEAAKLIGKEIAKKANELNIKEVVFDRSGYKYHGRIKTLADAAREAGLKF